LVDADLTGANMAEVDLREADLTCEVLGRGHHDRSCRRHVTPVQVGEPVLGDLPQPQAEGQGRPFLVAL
jgi:hypothetical protein